MRRRRPDFGSVPKRMNHPNRRPSAWQGPGPGRTRADWSALSSACKRAIPVTRDDRKPTAKPDTRPDYAFPPCHKIELVMGTGEARCDSITVRPDVGGRDSCGTTAPSVGPHSRAGHPVGLRPASPDASPACHVPLGRSMPRPCHIATRMRGESRSESTLALDLKGAAYTVRMGGVVSGPGEVVSGRVGVVAGIVGVALVAFSTCSCLNSGQRA